LRYRTVFASFCFLPRIPFNTEKRPEVQIRNQKVGGSIPPVSTKT